MTVTQQAGHLLGAAVAVPENVAPARARGGRS